ncbi:hypothetical protein Tco_0427705 [Tanacetum coccineum]
MRNNNGDGRTTQGSFSMGGHRSKEDETGGPNLVKGDGRCLITLGSMASSLMPRMSGPMMLIAAWSVRSKIFCVRAKEVSSWITEFEEEDDDDSKSDEKMSKEGIINENGGMHKFLNVDGESDIEAVAETIFKKEQSPANVKEDCIGVPKDTRSKDTFNIYELLNKNKNNNNGGLNSDDNLKYPHGFTPATDVDVQNNPLNELDVEGDDYVHNVQDEKVKSATKKNSPFNSSKNDTERSVCSCHFKKCEIPRSGGSILQLMDELDKVGQIMGYNMMDV